MKTMVPLAWRPFTRRRMQRLRLSFEILQSFMRVFSASIQTTISFGGVVTGRGPSSWNRSSPSKRGRPLCRTVFCALHGNRGEGKNRVTGKKL